MISQTRRKEIIEVLKEREMTLKELVELFQTEVKEIVEDLIHISQSVKIEHKKLKQRWAICNNCGFTFKDREKFTRPTKCPKCRSEDITEPSFRIE